MQKNILWLTIGIVAACLTMFAFLPQIFKSLKTRSVKDVSIITLTQLSCGVTLWIIYGIYLKDKVIIIANSVTLVSLVILLYLYFAYKKKNG